MDCFIEKISQFYLKVHFCHYVFSVFPCFIVLCLFEETGGDIVFGFLWCMIHGASVWCVIPSL